MHPIDALEAEHRTITASLAALEAWASDVTRADGDDRKELGRFVALFHGFVDDCHHGKEEDILFRTLLAHDRGTRAEIASLMREHGETREVMQPLEELAFQAHPWTSGDRRALVQATARYAAIASDHMAREERWLFPRARALPAEACEDLSRALARFEAVENGGSKHRRLRALADELIAAHSRVCEHVHVRPRRREDRDVHGSAVDDR